MTREETQKVLNKFAKDVIKQSKENLKKYKKIASKDLYESLLHEVEVFENSLLLSFKAEDYWKFVDKGVSGTEKRYQTPYKYTTKKPPVNKILTWTKYKTQKFRRRNQLSIAYAIRENIFKYGLEPTHFFSDVFEAEFDKLPEELIKAYALDLENFMEFVFKNNLRPQ